MKESGPHRCPISYDLIPANQRYSLKGLKQLSPKLKKLDSLPLSAREQRIEARKRAHKMSIQGIQPKLSAKLNIKEGRFEIVDQGGKFILKPPHELYPELTENEDLTMRLAKTVGIETPLHGLLYASDGSFTYFIKRFDREGHKEKVPLEDFAQLAGLTRETKYDFSIEKIIPLLDRHCTFPMIEKKKFFLFMLFNFLVGNEDMHLKNYSLISREDKVEFSPAYDLLNTTIALGNTKEETALSLKGKKSRLTKKDLIDYLPLQLLGLNETTVTEVLDRFRRQIPHWSDWINISFLSEGMKEKYRHILSQHRQTLEF